MESITVTLVQTLGTIIITLGTIWLKKWLSGRYENRREPTLKDKSLAWYEIDELCSKLRSSINANAVWINYFHNGGAFITGVKMDKFTCVGEDFTSDIPISFKTNYKNVLTSIAPYGIHKLYANNSYELHLGSDLEPVKDKAFIRDMIDRGTKTVYSIMIRDLINNTPIGFIIVEHKAEIDITAEYTSAVWKKHGKAAQLLQMIVN